MARNPVSPYQLKTTNEQSPFEYWALDAKQGLMGFTLVAMNLTSVSTRCFDTPGHTSDAGAPIDEIDCVTPGAGMRFTFEAVP